jgi:hypothetical protein
VMAGAQQTGRLEAKLTSCAFLQNGLSAVSSDAVSEP